MRCVYDDPIDGAIINDYSQERKYGTISAGRAAAIFVIKTVNAGDERRLTSETNRGPVTAARLYMIVIYPT